MKYTCPVCGYDNLEDAPANFEICPSCGTEFGYNDITVSHQFLGEQWIKRGMHWHSRVTPRPIGWDPIKQLKRAGLEASLSVLLDLSALLDTSTEGTVELFKVVPLGVLAVEARAY